MTAHHKDEWTVEQAAECMIDALLRLVDDKDDDDLIFVDGILRSLATELNIPVTWAEIEPMTAREFRTRWRAAKASLAAGDLADDTP